MKRKTIFEALKDHTKDEDCAPLLSIDNYCLGCGVQHGDPCPECKGTGFHTEDCNVK